MVSPNEPAQHGQDFEPHDAVEAIVPADPDRAADGRRAR